MAAIDSDRGAGERLRQAFDGVEPLTLGIEEELILLDPESGLATPRAAEVLARTEDDARFRLELPAAQLEIVLPPVERVADAVAGLGRARRDLAGAAVGIADLAAAGVPPLGPVEGELSAGERYRRTEDEYGAVARRQLVFALQVHVAIGSAASALAVFNWLRSFLPEIAALAANAPYLAGVESGFASVRPKISEALPRQGLPPAIESWEAHAADLAWGERSGAVPEPGVWWWEARPHPRFGTIELRVPDAQSSLAEAAGVIAFAHALIATLLERVEAGERPPAPPSWRIAENRWWAARDGVEGALADLASGERRPTRERLDELIEEIAPAAERLGCAAELALATQLIAENGAIKQRRLVAERGIEALPKWLAGRYLG